MLPRFGDPRLPSRFWAKVRVDHETGCWVWTAAVDPNGYGRFHLSKPRRRTVLVHRLTYETLVGPINAPTINHECYNHPCCNPGPGHACEPMTVGANTKHAAARRLHCRRGHRFTKANTIWKSPTV